MASSTDIARLFVLLSAVGCADGIRLATTHGIRRNAEYFLRYFPNWTKEELCIEAQRLIKQLPDSELKKTYGAEFATLPIEQRYSICIEIPVHFNNLRSVFKRWFESYTTAMENKWFAKEEAVAVRRRIREEVERTRQNAQQQLEKENPTWLRWENAKEMLFVLVNWRTTSINRNVLHRKTVDCCVILKSPGIQRVHYVTFEDAAMWGQHEDVIWAEAVCNGGYRENRDGTIEESVSWTNLMPNVLRGVPEKQWEERVYKNNPDFWKWTQMLLGRDDYIEIDDTTPAHLAENEGISTNKETRTIVAEGSSVATSKKLENKKTVTKSAPKIKSFSAIKKTLNDQWNALFSLFRYVYIESTIRSRDLVEYSLLCNVQRRKVVAQKNLKGVSAELRVIELELIECVKAVKATRSIDMAFDMLCFVSHEIVTFEKLIAKLKTHYGYIYQTDPVLSEVRNECFTHYVALLRKNGQKEFAAKKTLTTETHKLAQQHNKVAIDVEKCRATITQATVALKESIKHQEEATRACQSQKPLLEQEIVELEATLEQVNHSIVALEAAVAANEIALADATAQNNVLLGKLQVSQSDHERFVAQGQLETATLQNRLTKAEDSVQKALFFRKVKLQRVEELKKSLSEHQEEMQRQMAQFEEKKVMLQKAYDIQVEQTARFALVLAENREALARHNQEKAELAQKIEGKRAVLQELEQKTVAANDTVAKKRDALEKKEKELEVLLSKFDDCTKALECNRRKEASFDEAVMDRIQIYPSNFSCLETSFAVNAISEYAFVRQIADAFNTAISASSQIAMLENQRLHMQALQQAIAELVEEGTISSENIDPALSIKQTGIEERLHSLAVDIAACQAAFGIADENASKSPSTAVVKKARKLFESYWTFVSDGALEPQDLPAALDGVRCLQLFGKRYLCFTPFYIVALEFKKSSCIEIELVKYAAISMEAVESHIALDYGQGCPDGATIIGERWQYETINGTPDRRYANNRSHYVVALNGLKLVYNGRSKIVYFNSAEQAEETLRAFNDLRGFLHNENADVMKAIFEGNQIPDVIRITTEIAEDRKKEEKARKEQERQLKQRELMLRKQKEEEKRQKEQHQKLLELWADNDQRKKAEDAILVTQMSDLLPPVTALQLANWDMQQSMPVTVSDKRRVITTGITKVEFVQIKSILDTTKYLAFFADETGKEFSDVRTLVCSPVGTRSVIPFEIKTQSISNPSTLYLLVRNMEDGKLVGKFDYKMNITFTNDFDL